MPLEQLQYTLLLAWFYLAHFMLLIGLFLSSISLLTLRKHLKRKSLTSSKRKQLRKHFLIAITFIFIFFITPHQKPSNNFNKKIDKPKSTQKLMQEGTEISTEYSSGILSNSYTQKHKSIPKGLKKLHTTSYKKNRKEKFNNPSKMPQFSAFEKKRSIWERFIHWMCTIVGWCS